MPHQEHSHFFQKACVWATAELADDYGKAQVNDDDPTEIICRWVDKKTQMTSVSGETISVDATVEYKSLIEPGSLMMLTAKADLTAGSDLSEEDERLLEVKAWDRTPDLKNRVSTYRMGLVRFREKLPRTG